jgi:multidrug transporter EmrE-like cation transporter
MTKYLMLLTFAVILNAGSSVFYKFSSLNSEKQILSIFLMSLGLFIGAINAVLYTYSLKGISLNTAYPIFSAGSLILVTLISIFIFNEVITIQKITGIIMLTVGVVLVSI